MLHTFCKEVAVTWRKAQTTNLALAGHAVLQSKTLALCVWTVSSRGSVSFASPGEPVEVILDRSLVFLIRDMATGTVLFLGHVLNPA